MWHCGLARLLLRRRKTKWVWLQDSFLTPKTYHIPQTGALKPTAALVVSPTTIPALATATLDASGSACYNGPCTYAFVVACSGFGPFAKSGTAATATITTGKGSGSDLNLLTVPAGTTCSVALTVTDIYAATATASGTLQVWSSVNG